MRAAGGQRVSSERRTDFVTQGAHGGCRSVTSVPDDAGVHAALVGRHLPRRLTGSGAAPSGSERAERAWLNNGACLNDLVPTAPFFPFRTERLVIRPLEGRDLARLVEYRNDPEVARYQDWELPYTDAHAQRLLDEVASICDPVAGQWINIAVSDESSILRGDIAVWLDPNSLLAMVGYTLARDSQRLGFATEAVGAVVDRLFDLVGVHRVSATLDPANVASAAVLERLGFRYEGCSVGAALVRGAWLDDDRYAVLANERRAWTERPRTPPDLVELVEIGPHNAREAATLTLHRSQQRFVSSVAESLIDALHPETVDGRPVQPWYRGVVADGSLVGFVMVADPDRAGEPPMLWRLLVDRRHQRRGIGMMTIRLLATDLRRRGHTGLLTSWVPGRGGPEPFYRALGFVPTGRIDDGEVEAHADLGQLLDAVTPA
jgi:RimJ/RimL family protein N-acetyltransferase/GNAT superfamily N-acetyltransferase